MGTLVYEGKEIEVDDVLIKHAEAKITFPDPVNEKWINRFIKAAQKNGLEVEGDLGHTAMNGIQILLKEYHDMNKAWKQKMSDEGTMFTAFYYNGKMFSINSALLEKHRIKTGVEVTNAFMGKVLEETFTDEEFDRVLIEDLEEIITEQLYSIIENGIPDIEKEPAMQKES